jgi:integrase
MGIYQRTDSPYWWKKYDIDPETKRAPRKPTSTRIFVDAPTKEQRATNRRDAEIQYQQDCIDIRAGVNAPVTNSSITFREFARWYLEHVTANVRGKQQETSTIDLLIKDFGHYALKDITIPLVREWRTTRIKTVIASTVNQNVSVLQKMLTKAIPEHLAHNPLAARKPGTHKAQLERLDEDEFEARAFTVAEFDRFVAVLASHDDINEIPKHEGLALAYSAIEILVRRKSLLKLTWADYRDTHFVTKNTKVSRGRQRAPKTKPVTANMRRYLDCLPRETPQRLIFSSFYKHKSGFSAPVWRWFNRVCELAAIPYGRENDGVTFHSFRHTGATWYLKAGYSVKAVMQLGGWTNAQLFLDTYVHVSEEEIADMANSGFSTKPESHS